jgi:glutamyl-tRNA reductase
MSRANGGSLAIPLVMMAIDYTQASTRVRAAMSLSVPERDELVRALRREGMQGFVQISTCNRTLWLTVARHPEWAGQLLEAQAQSRWAGLCETGQDRIRPSLHIGMDAVRELMRIATGLRSFVVGERQVSGQVHRAFEHARQLEQSHPLLNMLDTSLGRAVREVHRKEGFGVDAEGLHTVVEACLQSELGPPGGRKIRVLGAGEIGQAICGRLEHQGWWPLVANRTPKSERGWAPIQALRGLEDPCEALVVATGAREPIWGIADLPPSVQQGERSLLVLDVGSPSQVCSKVGDLPGVRLVQLDGLLTGARSPLNPETRQQVEQVVIEATDFYRRKLIRQSWSGAWRAHQEATDAIARKALPACLDRHGIDSKSECRVLLEDDLRQLITRYGHRLLDAMARGVPDESEPVGLDDGGGEA